MAYKRPRAQLRTIRERSMKLLCDLWKEQGDLQSSLLMVMKIMELTPYSGVSVRKLNRAHIVLDDKAVATKVLDDWKAVLAKDLEIIETHKIEDLV